MGYYGRQVAVPRALTMYTGVVPTFAAAGGYGLLSACPPGRSWKIESVWMQNNHATQNFVVSLSVVPGIWIGTVGDPLLRVFTNLRLVPGELAVFNETIGLRNGDRLYGFQYEPDTGSANSGVNMHIAGVET